MSVRWRTQIVRTLEHTCAASQPDCRAGFRQTPAGDSLTFRESPCTAKVPLAVAKPLIRKQFRVTALKSVTPAPGTVAPGSMIFPNIARRMQRKSM